MQQITNYRSLGTVTAFRKVDLPPEAIVARLRRKKATGKVYIDLDLSGVDAYDIPAGALLDVEIKDNALMASSTHAMGRWGSADRKCIIVVDKDFNAARNTVIVSFVAEQTSLLYASSAAMHVPDDDGEDVDSGQSYIKFMKKKGQSLPATIHMSDEGPCIWLGDAGPANGGDCERDPAFLNYALPNMIRLFAINLVNTPEGFDNARWKLLRADLANWGQFEDWEDLMMVAKDKGDGGVEVSERCASGLYESARFKAVSRANPINTASEDQINAA